MPEGKIHRKRLERRERNPKHLDKKEKKKIDELRDRFDEKRKEMENTVPAKKARLESGNEGDIPRVSRILQDYISHRALSSDWKKIQETKRLEQSAYQKIDDVTRDPSSGKAGFSDLLELWDDLMDPFDMDAKPDYKSLVKCGSDILEMVEKIRKKKEAADKKGELEVEEIMVIFRVAEKLVAVIDIQLKRLSEGRPVPVANPAEALIDSCFEVATLNEHKQILKGLKRAEAERDSQRTKEGNLLKELAENKLLVSQLSTVVDGKPAGKELKSYLKELKDELDDKLNKVKQAEGKEDYEARKMEYDRTKHSNIHEDLDLFFKSGDISEDLYIELEKIKSDLEYRDKKISEDIDNINSVKEGAKNKKSELVAFERKLDEALNKLESGGGRLREFWAAGIKSYQTEIKRMEKVASEDQKKNLKSFRGELTGISDIGFDKAAKQWEALLQKPGVEGPDGYIDFKSMTRLGEEIRHLMDATISRINKLEKNGMEGLGGRNKKKLKELLMDFKMNCSAILRRIGSSLTFFYSAKRSLGQPFEDTVGVAL